MGERLPDLELAPDGVDALAWEAACSAVREACGWHIAPVFETTCRVRVEGHLIRLPSLAVESVSAVTIDGRKLTDDEFELMPEPVIYLRRRPCSWHDRPVVATVTFSHGFARCPAALVSVIQAAASRGMGGSLIAQVGQVRLGGSGVLPGAAEAVAASSASLDPFKLGPRP